MTFLAEWGDRSQVCHMCQQNMPAPSIPLPSFVWVSHFRPAAAYVNFGRLRPSLWLRTTTHGG